MMTLEDRIRQNLGTLALNLMQLQAENELLRKALEETQAELKSLKEKPASDHV